MPSTSSNLQPALITIALGLGLVVCIVVMARHHSQRLAGFHMQLEQRHTEPCRVSLNSSLPLQPRSTPAETEGQRTQGWKLNGTCDRCGSATSLHTPVQSMCIVCDVAAYHHPWLAPYASRRNWYASAEYLTSSHVNCRQPVCISHPIHWRG